jgi:Glycyl-tRNA synthetase, beta subunit
MERFRALAEQLAEQLNPAAKQQAARTAFLCKADLVSGMVGEFPEVQGIMGREYALHDGEETAVANAIAEHYLPTQAGGDLPASDIGAFVSLADKLDTLCGCFGVGLIPTGAADPYALRRATIGMISIILDKGYSLSLSGLIDKSLELLAAKLTRPRDEVRHDVLEFFRGRFVNLQGNAYPADVVEAAMAAGFDDLADCAERIRALDTFRQRDDFQPLTVAFKRVCNIIKEGIDAPVAPALFQDEAEHTLYRVLQETKLSASDKIQQQQYLEALTDIAGLKWAVDAFFDAVMVMAEDSAVRNNRLALLTTINRLFSRIADFGRLAG